MSDNTRMRYNYARTGKPDPAPTSGTDTRPRYSHGGSVGGVKHPSTPSGFKKMKGGGRTSY